MSQLPTQQPPVGASPDLIERGEFETVISYALLGIVSTEQICLMMQGQA